MPGHPFYVDIWGCESVTRCVPEAVVARGCTPTLVVQGDRTLNVEMFDVGAPELAACPPAAPEE